MSGTTFFAPAERAPAQVVRRQAEGVQHTALLAEVLAAVPDLLVVLNKERQIVFANRAATAYLSEGESVEGMRPGELVRCANVPKGPGGCGTSEACRTCGLVDAVLALGGLQEVEKEARLTLESGENLDFRVRAHRILVEGEGLSVVSIKDIADEKRRQTLERLFFHDVLNTAGGVQGLAGMLKEADGEQVDSLTGLLESSAGQLVDEIRSHRVLVAAEDGDYTLDVQTRLVNTFVEQVVGRYQPLGEANSVKLSTDPSPDTAVIQVDATLLGRVLGNLVKNAIEASRAGMTVTVAARPDGDRIIYSVHNETVMPPETQMQVFQRSFSTKGVGRGLGTYSVRLFTEKYLKGTVTFRSSEGEGTTFRVTLPLG